MLTSADCKIWLRLHKSSPSARLLTSDDEVIVFFGSRNDMSQPPDAADAKPINQATPS
jgi:hypothetical protein